MDLKLKGKRALVTASTGGIGRGIAGSLLKEGASVVIHGSREDSATKTLNELRSSYSDVDAVHADLSTAEGCQSLINQVNKPLDILINNFGIFETCNFFDISDKSWNHFFECNVMSGVRLSRHFLKPMLQENWGRIVFISSESGLNIPEDMIHYGFTKTAQLSLMRGLAKLTRGSNVTINSILPGPTLTQGVEKFLEKIASDQNIDKKALKETFVKENRSGSLIQRFAEVEEVANTVTYLCSPLAALTNGSAVKVEGGIVDQLM